MFSTATAYARPQQFANAYRHIGTETGVSGASPHRLVAMLFEGYMDAVAQARGGMRANNVERKSRGIQRALRIVGEGLRENLDMKSGGRLAQDLNDLYGYLELRLTQANIRNEEAILDECQRLMQPLQEAWSAIGETVGGLPGRG